MSEGFSSGGSTSRQHTKAFCVFNGLKSFPTFLSPVIISFLPSLCCLHTKSVTLSLLPALFCQYRGGDPPYTVLLSVLSTLLSPDLDHLSSLSIVILLTASFASLSYSLRPQVCWRPQKHNKKHFSHAVRFITRAWWPLNAPVWMVVKATAEATQPTQ